MKQKTIIILSVLACTLRVFSQNASEEQLEEVIINSSRIDLPFKENSRTITVITSEEIKNSAATNVTELLQQFSGIDIRRRGSAGMQADLYIRGGGFDQTLLLIDGFKVEDSQTGHHTLNMILPLEVIERIEIIKGPAARVFGQNAFTGAINIVTKNSNTNTVSVEAQAGSYGQKNFLATAQNQFENSSHIIHFSKNTSDGYRYNTDYDNQNYFIKSQFSTNKFPINLLATFSERKFGANGFYASPSAKDQYEETQASLVGFSTTIQNERWQFKPRLYWKRNQDEYLFVREDPSIYRNFHQTNKIALEFNGTYKSKWGTTGFGVDLAQMYISSNNLGQHDRFMTTMFAEHRFDFLNNTLDITPGIAATYFSDFKFHAFPGIDIGYKISDNLKIYGNIGYTYRIPTYTDLYYTDPTTIGNDNLDPEEAIAEELGFNFKHKNLRLNVALFNRDSNKLIDYVKEQEEDLWQAINVREVNTKGIEASANYGFNIGNYLQNLTVSYTYLEDDIQDVKSNFSKYSINSLKHHFTAKATTKFITHLSQTIIYKYAERTYGESYGVVDANITLALKNMEVSVIGNNIFNTEYTETNMVPMPKGNVLFGFKYKF